MTIQYKLQTMIPGPAASVAVVTIYENEDGILIAYGNTVPGGVAGYAIGCLFMHTDGGDATALYVNEGTAAVADFNAITVAA